MNKTLLRDMAVNFVLCGFIGAGLVFLLSKTGVPKRIAPVPAEVHDADRIDWDTAPEPVTVPEEEE